MAQEKIHHGGDLAWATAHFGYRGADWLDLSTGINATPYPVPAVPQDAYTALPGRQLVADTTTAAARYYGASEDRDIVLAPGSQALIQWLPRLRPQSRVAVVTPTYQEHANCWRGAGHNVVECASFQEALDHQADVVILVHPNNPTGALTPGETILNAADELSGRGGWLVVDEAFADVTPKQSSCHLPSRPNLITLKSFGKFFGLAGLRLGIAILDKDLAEPLSRALGPWQVAGPTLEVAKTAFRDCTWIEAARHKLAEDAVRMDRLLANVGCEIVGGTDLFRLAAHEQADRLFAHLGGSGIFIRHFDYAPQWLRLGLPGREEDWERLEKSLSGL